MKLTHKTVYTMDIKTAQRMLLAHWQLQGRATDAALAILKGSGNSD